MRVLVCGGRDFMSSSFIEDKLMCWWPREIYPSLVIITGGARGVDSIAHDWAVYEGISTRVYYADWDKYGKKAGYLRNKQMLEEGKPDLVIAFPGGRGTQMMITLAKEAGVPVEIVPYPS